MFCRTLKPKDGHNDTSSCSTLKGVEGKSTRSVPSTRNDMHNDASSCSALKGVEGKSTRKALSIRDDRHNDASSCSALKGVEGKLSRGLQHRGNPKGEYWGFVPELPSATKFSNQIVKVHRVTGDALPHVTSVEDKPMLTKALISRRTTNSSDSPKNLARGKHQNITFSDVEGLKKYVRVKRIKISGMTIPSPSRTGIFCILCGMGLAMVTLCAWNTYRGQRPPQFNTQNLDYIAHEKHNIKMKQHSLRRRLPEGPFGKWKQNKSHAMLVTILETMSGMKVRKYGTTKAKSLNGKQKTRRLARRSLELFSHNFEEYWEIWNKLKQDPKSSFRGASLTNIGNNLYVDNAFKPSARKTDIKYAPLTERLCTDIIKDLTRINLEHNVAIIVDKLTNPKEGYISADDKNWIQLAEREEWIDYRSDTEREEGRKRVSRNNWARKTFSTEHIKKIRPLALELGLATTNVWKKVMTRSFDDEEADKTLIELSKGDSAKKKESKTSTKDKRKSDAFASKSDLDKILAVLDTIARSSSVGANSKNEAEVAAMLLREHSESWTNEETEWITNGNTGIKKNSEDPEEKLEEQSGSSSDGDQKDKPSNKIIFLKCVADLEETMRKYPGFRPQRFRSNPFVDATKELCQQIIIKLILINNHHNFRDLAKELSSRKLNPSYRDSEDEEDWEMIARQKDFIWIRNGIEISQRFNKEQMQFLSAIDEEMIPKAVAPTKHGDKVVNKYHEHNNLPSSGELRLDDLLNNHEHSDLRSDIDTNNSRSGSDNAGSGSEISD